MIDAVSILMGIQAWNHHFSFYDDMKPYTGSRNLCSSVRFAAGYLPVIIRELLSYVKITQSVDDDMLL